MLNVLSCISVAGDPIFSSCSCSYTYLQTEASDYHILSKACSQLSSFPIVCPLYLLHKRLLAVDERSLYEDHLARYFVQHKLKDSVHLEACCGTWNGLLSGCYPNHFLFILYTDSNTLPTTLNLQQ